MSGAVRRVERGGGSKSTGTAGNDAVANGAPAPAQDAEADNVDFWQKLGGKVLNLKSNDWNRVALAS